MAKVHTKNNSLKTGIVGFVMLHRKGDLGRLHMSGGRKSAVYPNWVLNFKGASDWPQENMLFYMREVGRKYAWM
jgi:hypothetical protein